ncbi:DUF1801 domain-containing protein [Catenuloplanes atrovinosus]|uniref:YdhG-like domain-containing protein n=1 Tax=Catenuloplanes atrovinosus TaxID=137266 RepID=A0AAE3YVV9_9ACTN|nr:DUF1801 domain-containing protein [Catenuloplanes atrovinosus]MDR7279647.1 hypothetical protein [Catenuloplanes atrovinosus]
MAEPKTQRNTASVPGFLASVTDARRREDAETACALMADVTGAEPVMWGTSIVGFGAYRYEYASGRSGDWPAVGFSPRRAALTFYLSPGFDGYDEIMKRLGPHTLGKSCLYVKRLSDVDSEALRELISGAFTAVNGKTLTSGT